MKKTSLRDRILGQEDLNFLLTNRIPRIALTRWVGWLSRIESPVLARALIAVWKVFSDLDLREAKTQQFNSLHACFTRELIPGARPYDMRKSVLASPSDAIVGACGTVRDGELIQAKGFAYRLDDLLGTPERAQPFMNGQYVTLRLTSSMYHRFHAPADLRVNEVVYFSGDAWNVNPVALRRVERLYCKNERALLRCTLSDGTPMALVPVAAVLVASIRLHFLNVLLHLRYRGANPIACDAEHSKGQEMGWFEHGSTIIVFTPAGFELAPGVVSGAQLSAGQALLIRPEVTTTSA
jgi:phosphatidylserine decarboxylase